MMKRFFIAILFLFAKNSFAQTDTTFWFAAPEIINDNSSPHTDRPIILRITAFANAASVTISQPANLSFSIVNVIVAANSSVSVDLTSQINSIETKPANQVLNTGLLVSSTSPITAYYEEASSSNPEIFVLKGRNALGTSFFIPAQNIMSNWAFYALPPIIPSSSFDIVASEDNTIVTINPANDIIGHNAGIAFTVTLNKGQTYSATATGRNPLDHLMGSIVTSNKPIAVTIKDDSIGGAGYAGCLDLAGDQLVPLALIGTKYIALPGFLNNPVGKPSDHLFILATEDNTSITINGVLKATINKAVTYHDSSFSQVQYIETSKPAYVLHLTGFGCEVGHAVLPQIECTGSQKVAFTRSNATAFYMNILVPAGYENKFKFNGNTSVINAAQFNIVPFTGGLWKYAQVFVDVSQLPVGAGAIVENSDIEFHLSIIHGDASGGARYGYFSDFNKLNVTATSNAISGGICANSDLKFFTSFNNALAVKFNWTGPNGFSDTSANPILPNITANGTGVYTLTATKFSCSTVNVPISIVVNPIPNTVLTTNAPICTGNNLAVNANYAGGSFSWTGPNSFASSTATNNISNISMLANGYYKVVTTANGCSKSDSILVVVNPSPLAVLTVASTNVCSLKSLLISNNNAIPNTNYSWILPNGGTSLLQNINIAAVQISDSGKYVLTASTATCSAKDSVTINVIASPKPVLTTNAPICTSNNLAINANYAGGSFSWTGPNSFTSSMATNNISNVSMLANGYYKVVTNANGCSNIDSILVVVNPTPSAALTVASTNVCLSKSLLISNNNALPNTNYSWILPNGGTSSLQNINIASIQTSESGKYVLTASTGTCSAKDSVTIKVIASPKPSLRTNSPICTGNTLIFDAIFAGASFVWTGPNGFNSNSPTNNISNATTAASGFYKVVTTLGSCTSTDSIIAIVNPRPSAKITIINNNACLLQLVQLTNNNTLTNTTYNWLHPNATTSYNQNINFNTITFSDTGRYILTASTATCSAKDTAYVTARPTPIIQFLALAEVCNNVSSFSLTANEISGIAGNGGVFSGLGVTSNGLFTPANVGNGTTNIRYTFTANNGCIAFGDQSITVNPTPIIILENERFIKFGNSVALDAEITGVYNSLVWQDATNTLSDKTIPNPLAKPIVSTLYKIEVSTNKNCVATDSVWVRIASDLFIPNVFSPNGDGINDNWEVEDKAKVLYLKASIFNRYGKLVKTLFGNKIAWDGLYNGQPLPMATYYYVLTITNGRVSSQNMGGWIQLIR